MKRFIKNSIYEIDKNKTVPVENKLTTEDWHVLIETHNILKPFYHQTKRFQLKTTNRTHGAIWEAYPSYEYLLRHILTKKLEYVQDYESLQFVSSHTAASKSRKHFKTSIENCWGKLNEYYKKLDTLPIYIAALVLNLG